MLQLVSQISAALVVLVFATETTSQPARSKYVVSAEPIRVHTGPAGLCVAIDPVDRAGIWWWGPGRSGCTTRNTETHENATGIAALFHPTDAVVSMDPSGTVHAHFRLGLHARPGEPEYLEIDLTAESDAIRCTSTQATVKVKWLNVLDIPLDPPR